MFLPLSMTKPRAELVSRFLATQQDQSLTYGDVGATDRSPPTGYVVDHTQVELGAGEKIFDLAREALRQWRQFSLGWVDAWPVTKPPRVDQLVGVMGRAAGMWCVNACRVVYLVDEIGDRTRFGFAYGTLPGHLEQGEERFLIEWDRESNRVTYDILAFSRPNHLVARLGYPLLRRLQKRFGRDSARALYHAATGQDALPTVTQHTHHP